MSIKDKVLTTKVIVVAYYSPSNIVIYIQVKCIQINTIRRTLKKITRRVVFGNYLNII